MLFAHKELILRPSTLEWTQGFSSRYTVLLVTPARFLRSLLYAMSCFTMHLFALYFCHSVTTVTLIFKRWKVTLCCSYTWQVYEQHSVTFSPLDIKCDDGDWMAEVKGEQMHDKAGHSTKKRTRRCTFQFHFYNFSTSSFFLPLPIFSAIFLVYNFPTKTKARLKLGLIPTELQSRRFLPSSLFGRSWNGNSNVAWVAVSCCTYTSPSFYAFERMVKWSFINLVLPFFLLPFLCLEGCFPV